MKVLVTGWAGYLGPVIVRRFKEAGHRVAGIDVGWYLPDYAEPPLWPDEVTFGDIRDPQHWYYGVDVVVHLAGLSNDPMGDLDPDLTRAINEHGTIGFLHHVPGARHIVVSSCAVYGVSTGEVDEDYPPMPLTAYARGKAAVDSFLYQQIENYASLRLGTVYGYSPGHRLDLVVNRMVDDSLSGVVTATGNAQRPLVHIEDVADAILFMAARPETGIFNVVGETLRMQPLARAIAAFSRTLPVFKPASADARDYAASGAKLAALGWTAKRTVEGSLPVLVEKTYNLPPGKYERLHALKRLISSSRLDSSLRTQRKSAA